MGVMQSLQRQVLGLIGRAVVKSINAASKCQMIDVELLAGQQKAGIEHLEPYGFTSRAQAGAEAVVLFPDGDRSHAVAITVSDRRYRMKGLKTGEVALYDDQGQSVTLTSVILLARQCRRCVLLITGINTEKTGRAITPIHLINKWGCDGTLAYGKWETGKRRFSA